MDDLGKIINLLQDCYFHREGGGPFIGTMDRGSVTRGSNPGPAKAFSLG